MQVVPTKKISQWWPKRMEHVALHFIFMPQIEIFSLFPMLPSLPGVLNKNTGVNRNGECRPSSVANSVALAFFPPWLESFSHFVIPRPTGGGETRRTSPMTATFFFVYIFIHCCLLLLAAISSIEKCWSHAGHITLCRCGTAIEVATGTACHGQARMGLRCTRAAPSDPFVISET